MGEAKRRRMRDEAADAQVVTCAYRPASVRYVLPGTLSSGYDDAETDALDYVDVVRVPNAMQPVGWKWAGEEAEERLHDDVCSRLEGIAYGAFDRDANFLGAVDGDGLGSEPAPDEPVYGFTGDEIHIAGSMRDGFAWGDGNRDLREAFAGLVRIDARGAPIVEADAPVSVQLVVITTAIAAATAKDDEERLDGLHEHLQHLMILVAGLMAERERDPAAWIDLCEFPGFVLDLAGGIHMDEPGTSERKGAMGGLLVVLDDARIEDPLWLIGPAIGADPEAWISRDEPGAGMVWAELDAGIASMAWTGEACLPNADAQCVVAEEGDRGAARAMAALRGSRDALASSDGGWVIRHEDLGAFVALVPGPGSSTLVTWRFEGPSEGRSDPLMAESLYGLTNVPPDARRMADPRNVEGYESLSAVSLLEALPLPIFEPMYPAYMLVAAGRRGIGLADLCATLADVIRSGATDAAFAHGDDEATGDWIALTDDEKAERAAAAERADAFGGRVDALLRAMLSGIGPEEWGDVELNRDLRNMKDARDAGMTLEDMALAWLTNVHSDVAEDDVAEAGRPPNPSSRRSLR